VMSLTDPSSKMSKSAENPKSRILLTDPRQVILKKIKSALTDSTEGVTYEPNKRPGVSNLVEIMYHLQSEEGRFSRQEIAEECEGLSMRVFKERIAELIDLRLEPIRERYHELMGEDDGKSLARVADFGAMNASASAEATMEKVRNVIGL